MKIRPVQKKDCEQIAIIHKKNFYDHFLGMLPIKLIKKFYESFLSKQLIFLVCVDESGVLGFVLGGDTYELKKERKSFIRKNFWRLIVSIIFSPKIYPFVLPRLKIKKTNASNMLIPVAPFRLLSIGVEQKRSGIGSALIKGFENSAKQISVSSYGLSVYKTNKKAISFYEKNDLEIEKETETSLYFYKILI